jgi:hypothetical protein
MAHKIVNTENYVEQMAQGMTDKAFFVPYLECDILVDFGCADATLLKHINTILGSDLSYIGYDTDPQMISRARKNFPKGIYFSDWDSLADTLQWQIEEGYKVGLLLSSVVHEIYSYADVEEFWQRINSIDFEQIFVRDMMIGEDIDELSQMHELEAIKANAKPALLNSFVGRWGSLKLKRNLIHFLLKYRYEENWKREVRENYLPVTVEDFLKRLRKPQYRISHFRHIQYYHFTDCVKEDFGIEIPEATHLKIILNRK